MIKGLDKDLKKLIELNFDFGYLGKLNKAIMNYWLFKSSMFATDQQKAGKELLWYGATISGK